MAKVFLNSFGRFNQTKIGTQGRVVIDGVAKPFNGGSAATEGDGAQVFYGACSQDRVNIEATGPFSNGANLTISPDTHFVQVVTDGSVLVWTGAANIDPAIKQARAFAVAAGTYSFEVQAGNVLHIWSA